MKKDDKVFFEFARKQYQKSEKYKEETKYLVSLDGTDIKIKRKETMRNGKLVNNDDYDSDKARENSKGVICDECTYPLDYGTQEVNTCYGLKYLCRSCKIEFLFFLQQ